jgi:hypothetical protein
MRDASGKNRNYARERLTASHLAGLRPRPSPGSQAQAESHSPLGIWDTSTAVVSVLALLLIFGPELPSIFGPGALVGAPHPASDLLVLLTVLAVFGVFPIAFLQHLYLQNGCKRPTALNRTISCALALAAMFYATNAMKPLVGYNEKQREDRAYAERAVPVENGRSPASVPAE